MSFSDTSLDEYDFYEAQFDPLRTDRRARRRRRPRPHHRPKKTPAAVIAEVADTTGLEGGFQTTYTPARYESGWLLEALHDFYTQGQITDVMAMVKGGKEASVYRCAAHPATGETWLAAKVYRPRMFRQLRNDQVYRQGRPTLGAGGRPVDPRDARLRKAMAHKSVFGEQVAHTSWLMYEYTALQLLHAAGAAVPRPIAVNHNTILMQYIGDAQGAAPTLHEVNLDPNEVRPLFDEAMRHVALMLQVGRVHGDLSAYNILYWQGRIILIDFPQVVNSRVSRETHVYGSAANPDAYDILARDVLRVCDYFARYGLDSDPEVITRNLWQRFAALDPEDQQADASRWLASAASLPDVEENAT